MRWRKGTTDHDDDGRMGGSMKETDVTDQNVTREAAETNKPREIVEPKAEATANTIKAESQAKKPAKDTAKPKPSKKLDDAPAAEVTVEPGASPKEARAALNKQFEEADEKGQAAIIDETQIGLQVRGY